MTVRRRLGNALKFLQPCVTQNWCLAIVPEGNSLLWAIVKDTQQGPVLHTHGNKDTLNEALDEARSLPQGSLYTVSVLPGLSTICRPIQLPKLKPKEVRAAVLDTLEQSIASGISESDITYEIHSETEGSLDITAYVARSSIVNDHVDAVKTIALEPEWVVPRAPCLAQFLLHFGLQGWQYILDVGESESNCTLVYNGHVVESRSLSGGKSLLDPSGPTELVKQFLQHLMATFVAYRERHAVEDSALLTVTGYASSLATKTVASFLHIPLSPLHEVDDTSTLFFAAAIGAGLLVRPQMRDVGIPNFRQGKFSNPLLHIRRPLGTLILACCTFAAIVWMYGNIRYQHIVGAMQEDWKAITQCARTTPQDVAKQQAALLPEQPGDFVEQGERLFSQIERRSIFPLQPDTPQMSDLISWLSQQMEEAKRVASLKNENASLRLLHYILVKRPSKQHPKEKYKVRVDVEIETPSVVLARAFHERLLTQNEYIDGASDVTWTTVQDRYRASFFLKDKTVYFQVDS